MLSRFAIRTCGGLLVLGFLVLSFGCGGPDYKARGRVKGKVTIGGKNLTIGNVTLINKHKIQGVASIDKDGNYDMKDAPVGECTVTVSVPSPPQMGPGAGMPNPYAGVAGAKGMKSVDPNNPGRSISIMGEMPSEIVRIPEKYSKAESSGLTTTVTKGEQTFNIDLKP